MGWERELGAASVEFLKRGARLTTKEREDVPKSELGNPKVSGGKPGSYPMPDKEHARLAIAFADRYHPGSALAARVKAKAHKLFPDAGAK